MDYVKRRLIKHLSEPVAQVLAENLVDSVSDINITNPMPSAQINNDNNQHLSSLSNTTQNKPQLKKRLSMEQLQEHGILTPLTTNQDSSISFIDRNNNNNSNSDNHQAIPMPFNYQSIEV